MSIEQRRAAAVHTHTINVGLLMILVGIFLPLLTQPGALHARQPAAMVVSGVLYCTGLVLQYGGAVLAGEILAGVGAVSLIATFGWVSLTLIRVTDALQSADL